MRSEVEMGKVLLFATLFFLAVFYLFQYGSLAWDGDKTLVIVTADELDKFEPASVEISRANVTAPVFETLVEAGDKRGQYLPKLAEKWDCSSDGKVWNFFLHREILAHDGHILKAQDVVRSFARPQVERILSCFNIRVKIEAVDDFVVQFRLERPVAYFLDIVAWPCMAVVKEDESGILWGTGPFVLEELRPYNRLSLRAFEQYWQDSAKVKKIIFVHLAEESHRIRELKKLNADVAFDIDNRGDKENFEFVLSPSWKRTVLIMNCKNRPFNEIKGRVALQSGLNKKELVSKFFPDTFWACSDYLTPDSWACSSELKARDFNVALARRIFQKSESVNADNCTSLSVLTSKIDSDRYKDLDNYLVQELKNSGLILNVVELEDAEFKTVINRGLYELAILTEDIPCVDPGLELELDWGRRIVFDSFVNVSNFESGHVLALLDKARLDGDQKQRKDYYERVQYKLNESAAIYNVAWCHRKDGVGKKVRNWSYNRLGVVRYEKVSLQ
ncbi:ABC transporter substrate-binding protein [bacterium]|nr:ABC transporter substrate-binding protein [bacterium]